MKRLWLTIALLMSVISGVCRQSIARGLQRVHRRLGHLDGRPVTRLRIGRIRHTGGSSASGRVRRPSRHR